MILISFSDTRGASDMGVNKLFKYIYIYACARKYSI